MENAKMTESMINLDQAETESLIPAAPPANLLVFQAANRRERLAVLSKQAKAASPDVQSVVLAPGEDLRALRVQLKGNDIVRLTLDVGRFSDESLAQYVRGVRSILKSVSPEWTGSILVVPAGADFDPEVMSKEELRRFYSAARLRLRPEQDELAQAANALLAALAMAQEENVTSAESGGQLLLSPSRHAEIKALQSRLNKALADVGGVA